MSKYRKAIVAGIAGAVGFLGVGVAVTADNHISLNDWFAMGFAAAQAIGATIGVAVTRNA